MCPGGKVFVELPLPENHASSRKAGGLVWLGKYLSLALTLPASVAAGYIMGVAADHWLNKPFLRAVGIFLGMAAGLLQIFRELTRDERRDQRERENKQ